MRPLKLTLSAFGSYGGTEIVDFERIGSSARFFITGDTGQEKPIFDAITAHLLVRPAAENRTK